MDPQEELEKANARVNNRFLWHLYVWRWIRNRCMQCGNRMLARYDSYGKILTCSAYPNHKPYEIGLNITFSLWVIIFILLAIIITGSCQKKTVSGKSPEIKPNDTHTAPYLKER